ncbi:hypothetical protein NPIL_457541 [Nephila pilipes]|uniref:Uncharacterized protein n=1 Tax=Nephila pilipes TaxID=299642 RepID=A0A8X6T5T3_NEPPI|nr:hypothetical protein NPIL_457541 [Nephila pilipes]
MPITNPPKELSEAAEASNPQLPITSEQSLSEHFTVGIYSSQNQSLDCQPDQEMEEIAFSVIPPRQKEYHNIGFLEHFIRSIASFRNSKWFIIILVICFSFSSSQIFMGFNYLLQCPASPETPIHILILGLLGITVIGLRISAMVLRLTSDEQDAHQLTTAAVISSTALISFLFGEMISFFYMFPDFDSSDKYCNEVFYTYTNCTNFIIIGISFLASLLHFPRCRFGVNEFYAEL